MACNGVTCKRYKAEKPKTGGRYVNGQSRCQICEIYIHWEGLTCPCCGYKLRKKPRNLKYKNKFREATEIKQVGINYNDLRNQENV